MPQNTLNKKLYILDGHALAYRAYYALIKNPLTDSKGRPTGAVYGFANYLLKLLDEYKCPYITVVFDSSVPTFRHEKYKEYKANREEMPEDMKAQIPLIFDLVDRFNIVRLQKDGFEADDIIAYLAKRAEKEGYEVFLVTKDKDLMQLIGPKVKMISFNNEGGINILGVLEVKNKLGVGPEKIRDLLALMGDSSDNIPGIPGIGPKTAQKIIEEAGSIDNLLENPLLIKNEKIRNKILENKDALLLSKELATLNYDIPLDIPIETLAAKPIKKEECIQFFKELNFASLLKREMFAQDKKLKYDVLIAQSLEQIINFAKKIEENQLCAIDTETTSLIPKAAELVGISLAYSKKEAMYIPLGHITTGDYKNLSLQDVLMILKNILQSNNIKKAGQNLKYDYQILKNYNINMKGISFDVMVAAYVLDPGKRNYSLDALALEILGVSTIPIESLIGKGKNQKKFNEVSIKDAAYYSCEDVILPLYLKEYLEPLLEEQKQTDLFYNIEMPLVSILAEMEWCGVCIDKKFLAGLSKKYSARLAEVSNEIYKMAGEEFNLNSPKQISDILFNKLKLPKSKKTKTGLSTDVDALEKLKDAHPIIEKLLDYREIQKLLSTYIDILGEQVLPQSGRLHTTFNQTITATGRLSSANPNLQNIPVRTETGKAIREAFIAQKGYLIVSADYSQIELRILAHVSKDPFLTSSFMEDKDIHTQTASVIYGVFPQMVTPEMRRFAKTINFGLIYGMGAISLSRQLGISFSEAQRFIDAYFKQFPNVQKYIESAKENAKRNGYAETLLGRRRYVPDINSENRQIREAAERIVVNTPIQGTAADIIKLAMINISNQSEKSDFDFNMILQVHDELVFEVKESQVNKFIKWACDIMSNAYRLNVPLKVDAGYGKNWSEAH